MKRLALVPLLLATLASPAAASIITVDGNTPVEEVGLPFGQWGYMYHFQAAGFDFTGRMEYVSLGSVATVFTEFDSMSVIWQGGLPCRIESLSYSQSPNTVTNFSGTLLTASSGTLHNLPCAFFVNMPYRDVIGWRDQYFRLNSFTAQVGAVPEPTVLTLLLSAGLFGVTRRRKRAGVLLDHQLSGNAAS